MVDRKYNVQTDWKINFDASSVTAGAQAVGGLSGATAKADAGMKELGFAIQKAAMKQFTADVKQAEGGLANLGKAISGAAMAQEKDNQAKQNAKTASDQFNASLKNQIKSMATGALGVTAMVRATKELYSRAVELSGPMGTLTHEVANFSANLDDLANVAAENLSPAFENMITSANFLIKEFVEDTQVIGALLGGASMKEALEISKKMTAERKLKALEAKQAARDAELEGEKQKKRDKDILDAMREAREQTDEDNREDARIKEEQEKREEELHKKRVDNANELIEKKERLAEINRQTLADIGERMNPSSRAFVPGEQVGATSDQWRSVMGGAPIQGQVGSFVSIPDQSGFSGMSAGDESIMNAMEDSAERQREIIVDGYQVAKDIMESIATGDAQKIADTLATGLGGLLGGAEGAMLGGMASQQGGRIAQGVRAGGAKGYGYAAANAFLPFAATEALTGGAVSKMLGFGDEEIPVEVINAAELAGMIGNVTSGSSENLSGGQARGILLRSEEQRQSVEGRSLAGLQTETRHAIAQNIDEIADDWLSMVGRISDATGVSEGQIAQWTASIDAFGTDALRAATITADELEFMTYEEQDALFANAAAFDEAVMGFANTLVTMQEKIDAATEAQENFNDSVDRQVAELTGNLGGYLADSFNSLSAEMENATDASEALSIAQKQISIVMEQMNQAIADGTANIEADYAPALADAQAAIDAVTREMELLTESFEAAQSIMGELAALEGRRNSILDAQAAKREQLADMSWRVQSQFMEMNPEEQFGALTGRFQELMAAGNTAGARGILEEAQGSIMQARTQTLIGNDEALARIAEIGRLFESIDAVEIEKVNAAMQERFGGLMQDTAMGRLFRGDIEGMIAGGSSVGDIQSFLQTKFDERQLELAEKREEREEALRLVQESMAADIKSMTDAITEVTTLKIQAIQDAANTKVDELKQEIRNNIFAALIQIGPTLAQNEEIWNRFAEGVARGTGGTLSLGAVPE